MRRKHVLIAVLTAAVLGMGWLQVSRAAQSEAAAAGLFRITCGFSHSNADDMIVHPNRPGASHLHDYFGNVGAKASSTYQSLLGVRSTCPSGDTAAYWTPALYRNGKKVNPSFMTTYYTTPVDPGATPIQPFPADFRMIIGDAKNTDQSKVGRIEWGCSDNSIIQKTPPARCAKADHIQVRITFPSCWNGRSSGAANAVPNMRFPSRGLCPKGFGIPLPALRVNVFYKTGNDVGQITLSSGSVASAHADFVNTWDQKALTDLVRNCHNGKRNCPRATGTTPGRNP
jgi:hypothetical protein